MSIDQERNQKLCRRLSRLLGQLTTKPDARNVHQFRTTARRVETLLDALSTDPDRNQRKLLKQLARLRRKAGRVRNMDVQAGLLENLKIGEEEQRKKRVLKELAVLRERRKEKLVEAADKESVKELRRRLEKACERLRDDSAGEHSFDPVAGALREFAQVARTQGPMREETLHGYRLQTKHARYVAEMAGMDREAKQVVSELKRMQDAIGEWHDWLQLAQRAEKLLANGSEVPLVSAVKNITRAKYRQAIGVCAEVRKNLLELAKAKLPARKESAAATKPAQMASA